MNTNPQQSDSQQREELSRMLPGLVDRDLTNDRQHRLQEFVMNEINDRHTGEAPRRVPRARFALVTTAVIAVAAITAVTIGVAQSSGEDSVTKETAAPSTFDLAADYAAEQSYDPPDSDQWIYIETHELFPGSISKDKGQDPEQTHREWTSADGKNMARVDSVTGEISISDQDNEYLWVSTLPTDPEKLLAKVRKQLESHGPDCDGADKGDTKCDTKPEPVSDTELFDRVTNIIGQHLLPPKVEAALWKAIALIPGVTEEEIVEVDGKEALAVGRIADGWEFQQILVDPKTYAFVGTRGEAIKDHDFPGDGETIEIKKGEVQFEHLRLAAEVVDKPGDTG